MHGHQSKTWLARILLFSCVLIRWPIRWRHIFPRKLVSLSGDVSCCYTRSRTTCHFTSIRREWLPEWNTRIHKDTVFFRSANFRLHGASVNNTRRFELLSALIPKWQSVCGITMRLVYREMNQIWRHWSVRSSTVWAVERIRVRLRNITSLTCEKVDQIHSAWINKQGRLTGRFSNYFHAFQPSFPKVRKWRLSPNHQTRLLQSNIILSL